MPHRHLRSVEDVPAVENEVDAAGNTILSGYRVVVIPGPGLRHAVMHRSRGGWMLVYQDNGQVEFRDLEAVRRTVVRIP